MVFTWKIVIFHSKLFINSQNYGKITILMGKSTIITINGHFPEQTVSFHRVSIRFPHPLWTPRARTTPSPARAPLGRAAPPRQVAYRAVWGRGWREEHLREMKPPYYHISYPKWRINMYVCMYVCMHGWPDGWMHASMYISIFYIHIYTYIYIYIYIYIYRYSHYTQYIYMCIHTHHIYIYIDYAICVYIYVYVYVCIIPHIYTYL